ncbi:MAG: hypothetical protein AAF645_06145 [Myxococcota bacterium]
MNADDFQLGNGRVTYWDLERIDPGRPLGAQCGDLKEDLVQVLYGDVTLDVGWYPSFAADGRFKVVVVKDCDWQRPVFARHCTSIKELVVAVAEAARVASSHA